MKVSVCITSRITGVFDLWEVCGASKVRFPTLTDPQHDEVHSGGRNVDE